MFTEKALGRLLDDLAAGSQFLIAYSGGLDSTVLLHALCALRELRSDLALRALHVNHNLSAHAEHWQQHCEVICKQWQVPFETVTVQLHQQRGESLEAAARKARYAVLSEALQGDEVLLTAHNKNDQAETLLLQLMRGAGPQGLAAMPAQKPFAHSRLLRPLLTITRAELTEYAVEHGLSWVEDDSNTDVRFDRNYLRTQVLPMLRQRWPALDETIARSAAHFAEASNCLAALAAEDFKRYGLPEKNQLSLLGWGRIGRPRQKNLLRWWLHQQGVRTPDTKTLDIILEDVIAAAVDRQPQVSFDEVELHRFQQKLYVIPKRSLHDAAQYWQWDLSEPLAIPDLSVQLSAQQVEGEGLDITKLTLPVTVRFRQGGEQFKPAGDAHTRSLKHLFQQWGVPPWERGRIPLIFDDQMLVAVVGYGIAEGYLTGSNDPGYLISIQWLPAKQFSL